MKKVLSILLIMMLTVSTVLVSCAKKGPGNVIGVQTGTTGQYFVDGDADWGFDGINGYSSKHYPNAGLAVRDLLNGAVKYVIVDEAPALALEEQFDGVKVINIALTEEEYAFAVDKEQDDLLDDINEALEEIIGSGEFDRIVSAYSTGEGISPIESAKKGASDEDSQFVIATNAAFAPFEYMDGNKFAGIDMELAAAIADKLDMELVIEDMEFDAVVMSVGKHGVDAGAAALTVNETRKQTVNFSDSYYNASQVLITLEGDTTFDNCKTKEDVISLIK